MSTVEGKKQEKRRALLDAAYELFLERGTAKTSVEDITSRAKVGKGTFYLYFQDKGAVMQALLGRVSYQLLSDACLAVEQQPELPTFRAVVLRHRPHHRSACAAIRWCCGFWSATSSGPGWTKSRPAATPSL